MSAGLFLSRLYRLGVLDERIVSVGCLGGLHEQIICTDSVSGYPTTPKSYTMLITFPITSVRIEKSLVVSTGKCQSLCAKRLLYSDHLFEPITGLVFAWQIMRGMHPIALLCTMTFQPPQLCSDLSFQSPFSQHVEQIIVLYRSHVVRSVRVFSARVSLMIKAWLGGVLTINDNKYGTWCIDMVYNDVLLRHS